MSGVDVERGSLATEDFADPEGQSRRQLLSRRACDEMSVSEALNMSSRMEMSYLEAASISNRRCNTMPAVRCIVLW